jgi:hypothetical protein
MSHLCTECCCGSVFWGYLLEIQFIRMGEVVLSEEETIVTEVKKWNRPTITQPDSNRLKCGWDTRHRLKMIPMNAYWVKIIS